MISHNNDDKPVVPLWPSKCAKHWSRNPCPDHKGKGLFFIYTDDRDEVFVVDTKAIWFLITLMDLKVTGYMGILID